MKIHFKIFLIRKKDENEIKEDEKLLYFIQAKEEFWAKEIFNDPKFENEFEQMVDSFDVKVNEAINFYNVLGGDKELLGDKKEFEEKEEKGEEGGEEGEEREQNQQNLGAKRKKKQKKFY